MRSAEQTPTSAAAIQRKSATSFFGHASEQETPFFAAKEAVNTGSFFNPSSPLSKNPTIQAKLTVGAPNDKYEQEADSMADKVVQRLAQGADSYQPRANSFSTPVVMKSAVEEDKLQKKEEEKQPEDVPELQKSPVSAVGEEEGLQMKCADCEKEEHGAVQRKENGESHASPSIESRLSASKGSGNPLPNDTRSGMESAFGADFSGVRVHTGSEAVQMSRDLNAHAFTHGSDVYFNSGKYNPSNTEGSRLLAHELTHTVQQGSTQKKAIQKQPSGSQQIPVIPTKPSNTISINLSSNSYSSSSSGDPANKKNPDTYLPFDTAFEVWNPYLMATDSSLGNFNNKKVTQQIKGPTKSPSGKDFDNNVSFSTGVDAKGTAGSIISNTELKAAYDFKTYKWKPVSPELGIRLPDPPSYGKVAYPVEVSYRQIVDYSDAKGRHVKIMIYGLVHFTPEQWEAAIGQIRINKLPPTALLQFKGEFGSYHWKMVGKGALQAYNFENLGGATGATPNLQNLAQLQPVQTVRNMPLPFPNFTQPYILTGEQFKAINNYLDAADKIEQNYQAKVAALPQMKNTSGGGEGSLNNTNDAKEGQSNSGWTMPAWLEGILLGLATIAIVLAMIAGGAELIVLVAAFFKITLAFVTVFKALGAMLLAYSFLKALYTRTIEANQQGNTSPFKVLGVVLLDTFGISDFVEAITDNSILTNKPLNRSSVDRWKAGTVGLVTSFLSFLGLKNLLKGKTSAPLSDKTPLVNNQPGQQMILPENTNVPKQTTTTVKEPVKEVVPEKPAAPITEPVSTNKVTVTYKGEQVPIYRGGSDFKLKPGEFKVTPKGKYPARGLSINAEPEALASFGPKKIVFIPEGLEMIFTPSKAKPGHFDIIPKDLTITEAQFQALLNLIRVE